MQSDCVFTTSPTPSPTHPLSVPYTSPTSPTNSQRFQIFLQVVATQTSAPKLTNCCLRSTTLPAAQRAPECAISRKQAHRVSAGQLRSADTHAH